MTIRFRTKTFLTLAGMTMVLCAGAAQGSIIQTNTDATIAASDSDLLQTHLDGTPTLTGQWDMHGRTGAPGALTDGTAVESSGYASPTTLATAAAEDAFVTFDLDLTASPLGYEITQIDFFHGWNSNGRDRFRFKIEYATVATPSTFIEYGETQRFDPGLQGTGGTDPNSYGLTSVTDSSGVIATGVAKIRINPFEIENDYGGISEIDVFGSPLTVPAVPEPASIAIWSVLGLCLAGYGYRRRRNG